LGLNAIANSAKKQKALGPKITLSGPKEYLLGYAPGYLIQNFLSELLPLGPSHLYFALPPHIYGSYSSINHLASSDSSEKAFFGMLVLFIVQKYHYKYQ
jgi:hypothetical protein